MQKHVVICDVCGIETEAGGPDRIGNIRIYSHFVTAERLSPTGAFAVSPTGLVYDLCPGCMSRIDGDGLVAVLKRGLSLHMSAAEEDHGTVRGTLLPAGSLSRLAESVFGDPSEEDPNV